MADKQHAVDGFLERVGLDAASVDMEAVLEEFLAAMGRGLQGANSSLAMIPTFLNPEGAIPAGRSVVVMDAGGTHLRVATLTFQDEGLPRLDRLSRHPMPASQEPLSKAEFFDRLAGVLRPLMDASDRIGCCFSYPAEITPDHDARLMYWSQEIQAPDVEGELIGAGILERLSGAHRAPHIAVLNDTVATLLAARSCERDDRCAAFVGFILGTGTNTAYVERNREITKRDDLDAAGAQVINVEAGNFKEFPRGPVDEAFDRGTSDPGWYRLEKMVSGGYLGGLALRFLQAAADEGLFAPAAAEALQVRDALSTVEVSRCLGHEGPGGVFASDAFTRADLDTVQRILSALVERAARLTAVNLAAACVKTGTGHDPAHPLCINADGSTFHKVPGLRARVEVLLGQLLDPRNVHVELLHIENAPLLGAGVAALLT